MSDLIERQALRSEMYHEAFEKDSNEQRWDSGCWIRYKMFERVVDRLPPAQPEIVRCKDCRYWEDVMNGKGYCKDMSGFGRWWKDNDFCSRAERRE